MKLQISEQDKQAIAKILEGFSKPKTEEDLFYNLCFCLCAPQTTFKNNIKVIDKLRELDFYYFGETYEGYCGIEQIEEILKPVRFYKNKTKYLLEAKKKFPIIITWLKILLEENDFDSEKTSVLVIRGWLVANVKGLGYKTASHFLRNIGHGNDLAIVDTHIIKFLAEELCVNFGFTYEEAVKEFRKQATKKDGYLGLEKLFKNVAKQYSVSCAEFDIYLWKNYSGTSWEDFKY